MDALQLLEEAGEVHPAEKATIDAAVDLVLTAASRESSRPDSARSAVWHGSRRRRREFAVAFTAVAALGAAAFLLVSALGPASLRPGGHLAAKHPARSHTDSGPGVQLAAWTVARQANGNIRVTFRETADAAGLQRTLRADGVPVNVTFTGHQNQACKPYPARDNQAFSPFGSRTGPLERFGANPKDAYETQDALVIDPSALPSGAGLQIWTSGSPGAAGDFQLQMSLVQTSPQCTGR